MYVNLPLILTHTVTPVGNFSIHVIFMRMFLPQVILHLHHLYLLYLTTMLLKGMTHYWNYMSSMLTSRRLTMKMKKISTFSLLKSPLCHQYFALTPMMTSTSRSNLKPLKVPKNLVVVHLLKRHHMPDHSATAKDRISIRQMSQSPLKTVLHWRKPLTLLLLSGIYGSKPLRRSMILCLKMVHSLILPPFLLARNPFLHLLYYKLSANKTALWCVSKRGSSRKDICNMKGTIQVHISL